MDGWVDGWMDGWMDRCLIVIYGLMCLYVNIEACM